MVKSNSVDHRKRKRKRKQSLDPGDPPYAPYEHDHFRMELDSHADTCAVGKGCMILGDTGRTMTVGGFDDSMEIDNVPVVHAAVAYDCPESFKTFILIFHEALHFPELEMHLLNPFQMRNQGVIVNEKSLQQTAAEDRTKFSHSVVEEESGLHIPLTLQGTMSGFTARMPTMEEVLDESRGLHVHMTSHERWKPHGNDYAIAEAALRAELNRDILLNRRSDIGLMQARGQVGDGSVEDEGETALKTTNLSTLQFEPNLAQFDKADGVTQGTDVDVRMLDTSGVPTMLSNWDKEYVHQDNDGTTLHSTERCVSIKTLQERRDYAGVHDIDQYAEALMEELGVSEIGARLASATTKKKRPGHVGPEQLAKNWKIGLEAAKRTVDATTQLAVRDFTSTTGTRRLKPHHWLLEQKRLSCPVYNDTFGWILKARDCFQSLYFRYCEIVKQ